jgi:hypothetical protein
MRFLWLAVLTEPWKALHPCLQIAVELIDGLRTLYGEKSEKRKSERI